MKWFKKKIWQFCCITFDDDDDDVCGPPYGEDMSLNSAYCGKKQMICGLNEEVDKMDYVFNWIMSCRADWADYGKNDINGKKISEETTYYPSATTCTSTAEVKKTDTEAIEFCHQMAEINKDLILLSQKLDEIAALEKLL